MRIILKNFCTNLINKAYGVFFRNLKVNKSNFIWTEILKENYIFIWIKDMAQRKKLEDEEICYYYWCIQFLTEFIRHWDIDDQTKIDLIR